MPTNNPSGENGTGYFGGFGGESAYGSVKRLTDTLKQAPLPPNRAISAPERARKSGGRRPQQERGRQGPPVQQQLEQAPPPPSAVWAELAAIPGMTPLAAVYAQDA